MRKQNWLNFLKNYDFNIRVEGFSHIEGAWKYWMECSKRLRGYCVTCNYIYNERDDSELKETQQFLFKN